VERLEAIAAKVDEGKGLRDEAVRKRACLLKSARREAFDSFQLSEPLSAVCTAIIDNLHSNPVYSSDGVPCVRSPDVGWGSLDLAGARTTSEDEYLRRTVRGEPAPGDIVFVREGGGTGKAALVGEGQRFSLGQRVMMLRPDRNKVIPEFLLQQILSPGVQDEQIAPLITGSAAPHLNIGDLRRFRIVVPPYPVQEQTLTRLAAVLQRMDALAAAQRQNEVEIDSLMRSVLARAFRGEL
jgi:type I restriction enzyme S subunit